MPRRQRREFAFRAIRAADDGLHRAHVPVILFLRVLREVGPPMGGVAVRLAAALFAPHPTKLLRRVDRFQRMLRLPEPMLARSGPLPTGRGWLYEPKLDGFRCLVCTHGRFRTRSRRGWDMTNLLPELGQTLPALPMCRISPTRVLRASRAALRTPTAAASRRFRAAAFRQ